MVGRYGKRISGSDSATHDDQLESLEFDDETRELIGLDDIETMLQELSIETESLEMDTN